MGEVRAKETVEVAVPPERAYNLRLDFMRLPEYNPNVSNVKLIEEGTEDGVGATYTFELTLPGWDAVIPNTLTITEAVPYERVVCEIESGMNAREVCTFSRTSDGGTHIEFEGTIFVQDDLDEAGRQFIAQTTHEQDRMELDLIKKILEG